jgi:hypothetical protein
MAISPSFMQKTNVNNNNTALAKSIGFTILALVAVVAMLTTVTVIGGLQTVQAEQEPKAYCKEGTGICVIGTNQQAKEIGERNVKKVCESPLIGGEGDCSRDKTQEP